MDEYINREEAIKIAESCGTQNALHLGSVYSGSVIADYIAECISMIPPADVAPVRRGRWEEHYENEDGYCHHRCTTCKSDAPFDYKYTEDWDEGIDGEWFSLGFIVDGVNEHITPYCPNCGAKMDGGAD